MTLDLRDLHLSVPIQGSPPSEPPSARQLFLGDRELVRLAGLDDEFPPVAFSDRARNCQRKGPMTEPVLDDLNEAFERLTELRSAGLSGACLDEFFVHCGEAPSLMIDVNARRSAKPMLGRRCYMVVPAASVFRRSERFEPAFPVPRVALCDQFGDQLVDFIIDNGDRLRPKPHKA